MTDVPQATLYRQIERPFHGGVLAIAAEKRVRVAVERTYVLAEGSAAFSPEDMAEASRDDQIGYFTAFAAGLIASSTNTSGAPTLIFQGTGRLSPAGLAPERQGIR